MVAKNIFLQQMKAMKQYKSPMDNINVVVQMSFSKVNLALFYNTNLPDYESDIICAHTASVKKTHQWQTSCQQLASTDRLQRDRKSAIIRQTFGVYTEGG